MTADHSTALVVILERAEVEAIARIMGTTSGAAAALRYADSGAAGEDPAFVRNIATSSLHVVPASDVETSA